MKKINWILVATFSLMAMALVSCNKDITLQEIEQESAGTISVSVDGIMGEYAQGNETKAGLVSTTRVSWSAGDKVYVYDGASCLGELTVSLKDGKDYYAVLTGESITAPQTGTTKLTLVYSNATISEISNGKVTVDIAAQAGSTTPANIPFVAFGTLDYTSGTPEISGQIADFSLATSLMRLNCSELEANAAITGAKLTGMGNECVLNITKDGVSIGEGTMGDINISFTGVSANANGAQTLYAAVAKNGTASDQTLAINQANVHTYSFGSKAREAGKAFNAICKMEEVLYLPGVFTVADDGNGNARKVNFSRGNLYYDGNAFKFETNQFDHHGYDSGNNVWGTFGWSTPSTTYGMRVSGDYSDYSGVFVDWGRAISPIGTWRTLSADEWDYLINHHVSVFGTCNSATGLFIAPDGFEGDAPALSEAISNWETAQAAGIVFLPSTGIRANIVYTYTTNGFYWSSNDHNSSSALTFEFNSDTPGIVVNYPRNSGFCVRLVTDISDYVPTYKVTFDLNGKPGTTPESIYSVEYGSTITKPSSPTTAGYDFSGWYKDESCTDKWDFENNVVTANTTLYAGWKKWPDGALSGLFTVAGGKQVRFSQGNLWYGKVGSAQTASYNFEENQYGTHGYDYASNTWGLFGWSTSTTTYGMSTSVTNSDYSGNFVDWGKAIDNNGTWRTLSKDEWGYLFNGRDGAANKYGYATVSSKVGLIILPDVFTDPMKNSGSNAFVTGVTNTFTSNLYSPENWAAMESAGAIFLPAAERRYGTNISADQSGSYWSSSASSTDTDKAYYLFFNTNSFSPAEQWDCYRGFSVRLVTDVTE